MLSACSHGSTVSGGREGDANHPTLAPEIVQDAVVFEPGTKDGATVPELSSPSLWAVMVEEKIEGNRLIEKHREWILQGEVQLLGIPKSAAKATKNASKDPASKHGAGGSHED